MRRHGLAIAVLTAISVMAAVATIAGGGMDMDAWSMTSMARAPGWLALGLGEPMAAMGRPSWTAGYVAGVFSMWWLMMLAMMVPSALPALVRLGRDSVEVLQAALGYALAWGAFSLVMTGLQAGLDGLGLLSPMMLVDQRGFAAGLLVLAGLWQVSPAKEQCRTMLSKPGNAGISTGIGHGWQCILHCTPLMLLLFYGGVMNLWWIVGLALFVALEKSGWQTTKLRWASASALLAWGAALALALV